MANTKRHSSRNRRTQRRFNGGAGPFVTKTAAQTGKFINLKFNKALLGSGFPESMKATITDIVQIQGYKKFEGNLQPLIINQNTTQKPEKIMFMLDPGNIYTTFKIDTVPKFADAPPNRLTYKLMRQNDDYIKGTLQSQGGGGPGLGGLRTGATDTANTVNTGATKFFSGKL